MSFTLLKKAITSFKTLEVEFEDGTNKTYKMVLDMNAIAAASEATQKDFAKFSTWTLSDPKPTELLNLFWCSLKRFHPEVTLEEVGSWLNPESFIHVQNLLFALAFPSFQIAAENEAKSQGENQPNLPASEPTT